MRYHYPEGEETPGNITFGASADTASVVTLDNTLDEMTAFSVEFAYISTGGHAGSIENIFSAATSAADNMFNIYVDNRTGALVLDIGNESSGQIPGVDLHDNNPHNITVTWESDSGDLNIFDNGALIQSSTFQQGLTIPSGGLFMLGQEQDSYGGGLDASQSVTNAKIGHFSLAYDAVAVADITAGNTVAGIASSVAVDLRVVNGELVDKSGNFTPSVAGDITLPPDVGELVTHGSIEFGSSSDTSSKVLLNDRLDSMTRAKT